MSEPAIALQPFSLMGPLPPLAPLLWDWSYTGDGIDAQGIFTTVSSQDAGGYYQISGITGSRNSDAIIGLEPASDAVPGNAGHPVDNLINASGVLTANYTDVSLGNGNSTVALHGNGNTVTLGNGNQSVTGGDGGNEFSVGNGNSTISLCGRQYDHRRHWKSADHACRQRQHGDA